MINLNWYKDQITDICKIANENKDIWIKWNSNASWLDKETCLPNFTVYKRISINELTLVCKVIIQLEINHQSQEITKVILSTDNNHGGTVYITSDEGVYLFEKIITLMYDSFHTTMKFIM